MYGLKSTNIFPSFRMQLFSYRSLPEKVSGEPYESFDEFKLNFHRTVRTGEFLNLEGEFEKKSTIVCFRESP